MSRALKEVPSAKHDAPEVQHCGNCIFPVGSTKLPPEYQGVRIVSSRGIALCPRCHSPEVMIEEVGYTTSNGYNSADYNKGK